MDPIKEALTFDDVTMAPKYSEVLPSEVDTSTKLSSNLTLKYLYYPLQWIQLLRAKWL